MEILVDRGEWEITKAPSTLEAYEAIEDAGREAWKTHDKVAEGSAEEFVRMIRKKGHFAVFEFADMTVRFKNMSRGHSHELVRHRLFSFVQESTRYVDESNLRIVIPPGRELPTYAKAHIMRTEELYQTLLIDGWKREDARQFLPIGTVAGIVAKANFREWRHYFDMRADKPAHWEIRRAAVSLLEEAIKRWPACFDDFERRGECKRGIAWYSRKAVKS